MGLQDCPRTHLDSFDLQGHIDALTGNYTADIEAAFSRIYSGEDILYYTWIPNWTLNQLWPGEEVVWIEIPNA